MADRLIVLNGMPGAGKTTLARPLADALGIPLGAKDAMKEALRGDQHVVLRANLNAGSVS